MPSPGMGSRSVAELFQECSALEKRWRRENTVDRLKFILARDLTFRGKLFEAFSVQPFGTTPSKAELAARYQALIELLRKARHPDDRLNLLAQWLWAELGITPDEALGKTEVERLSLAAQGRIKDVKFNDLYYAGLVQMWLVYSERLFRDAKGANGANREKHLRTLGYDSSAVEIFTSKRWRSAVEFTCEWLARRAGIEMLKQRKDSDMAQPLRNAYTKIFGKGAGHTF